MKIGNWELRSPLIRYADISIEEDLYLAIRKSIIEDIRKELKQWR
jgi:hypothetical protein